MKHIKLLISPTVCTTSTAMAGKLKKVASKLLTEEAKHVVRWSHSHKSCEGKESHIDM